MIIFYSVCLIVAMLSLETLIVSGFRSANHRLLPLIIGLIALYDFYLIVECRQGPSITMNMLKDLLLIQVINLVTYFILDFMEFHPKKWMNVFIVSTVLIMDAIVCLNPFDEKTYNAILVIYTIISILFTLSIMIYASISKKYSRRIKHNNNIVFIMMFFPSVILIPSMFHLRTNWVVLPGSLMAICIMLDIFFVTDRLRDVSSYIKEELFHTFDVPAIIFDSSLCFIDASERARILFPEFIEVMEEDPDNYREKSELEKLKNEGGRKELEHKGRFYLIVLQEAYYNDKMQGYILRFIDITEQKMETQSAREMMRQKSEFLANMSHDLRSPLHAILGGSEIILSKNETSEYGRLMLNRIHEAGESLLEIVNSILEFSKIENSSIEFHLANYDIKKLIESQAQQGFVNLKNSLVRLSIEIPEDFPQILYGDELRVRQIIQNILSNAIKYTEQGSIECTLRPEITSDGKVRITYTVKDTGIGMTKAQLENVFGDYVTYADDVRKEGTGLGLSIVRKLTEMMGGYAKAESVENEGSTITAVFYQELPEGTILSELELHEPMKVTKIDQIDIEKIWATSAIPTYTYPDAKILIVDDMEINRVILKELIQPWNTQTDFAENGLEATKLAREQDYDLIILDQMMPVMTGTQAADIIRTFSDIPLVLLTANITDEMRRDSKEHGFTDFLQKPVDANALKNILEKNLKEEMRKPYGIAGLDTKTAPDRNNKSYKKSMAIFLSEMQQLYEVLPDYSKNDMELFRNKVHGIKGVSKQLDKKALARSAEIMEMAAITGNLSFIDNFFDTFYSDLELTIAQTQADYNALINSELLNEELNEEALADEHEDIDVNEALNSLFEYLEACDIEAIEEELSIIRKAKDNDNLITLADQIENLTDDFEYDEAIEVLRNYIELIK